MMGREWQAILARYGQSVTVGTQAKDDAVTVRAFLQPVLDKNQAQSVPSPLGLRREDRFLYLGPTHVPLTAFESLVTWQGQVYEVQSAHPVGARGTGHWWAMLRPRDKEST